MLYLLAALKYTSYKHFLNNHVHGNTFQQFDIQTNQAGNNISTFPLAPTSEFLKKGLSGKYITVFTCPNGQVDFLKTKHFLSLR